MSFSLSVPSRPSSLFPFRPGLRSCFGQWVGPSLSLPASSSLPACLCLSPLPAPFSACAFVSSGRAEMLYRYARQHSRLRARTRRPNHSTGSAHSVRQCPCPCAHNYTQLLSPSCHLAPCAAGMSAFSACLVLILSSPRRLERRYLLTKRGRLRLAGPSGA